jgi:sec-independent protein translocase protein TatA
VEVANLMIAHHISFAFFDGLGGPEVLVVLVVILIFFGGEKMPEFARGLGKAMREFKKAASEVEHEFKRAIDEVPEKPARPVLKPLPAPGTQPLAGTPAAPLKLEDQPPSPPDFHNGPGTSPLGDPPPPTREPPGDHGIDA